MVSVLHVNFISCQVGFVLSCLYKSNYSCSVPWREWLAILSTWAFTLYKHLRRMHWLFRFIEISPVLPCLCCFQKNRKKFYFGSTHFIEKSLLLHVRPNILVGNLWQLMTASKLMVVCAPRHNRLRGQFSKSQGLSASVSLPFFPSPYPLFYSYYFSCGLWLLFLVLYSESARNRLQCRLVWLSYFGVW